MGCQLKARKHKPGLMITHSPEHRTSSVALKPYATNPSPVLSNLKCSSFLYRVERVMPKFFAAKEIFPSLSFNAVLIPCNSQLDRLLLVTSLANGIDINEWQSADCHSSPFSLSSAIKSSGKSCLLRNELLAV